jgi:hypothetical protein
MQLESKEIHMSAFLVRIIVILSMVFWNFCLLDLDTGYAMCMISHQL